MPSSAPGSPCALSKSKSGGRRERMERTLSARTWWEPCGSAPPTPPVAFTGKCDSGRTCTHLNAPMRVCVACGGLIKGLPAPLPRFPGIGCHAAHMGALNPEAASWAAPCRIRLWAKTLGSCFQPCTPVAWRAVIRSSVALSSFCTSARQRVGALVGHREHKQDP